MNRNNIAARMGRWSATHWKTATFGWLAFVVVSFGIGGMVGMKTIDADAPGPGESGRMDRILDAGFPQPAGESILVQSSTLRTTDPEFRAAVHDVVAAISKLDAVQHVRSPLAPANSGQIAPNGHAALVGLQIRGDPDTAVDRIGPVLDRVDELQKAHPQLFIGQFGDASKIDALINRLRGRPRQGRAAVAPGHAGHPPGRLRHARGSRDPAAARADCRVRDIRPRRDPEPRLPGRDAGARTGAPDRSRGRRRLLDVLLEARTRGAGSRAQRTGGARGRGGDVGSLRARRRSHRDRRDGRHVPHRRLDLRVARRRRHHRRRDRGARLADGAAGAALAARRQGRPRPRAVRRPPPKPAARAGSGARSSTASCAGRSCRSCSPAGCWWRWRCPRSSSAWRWPAPTRSRGPFPSCRRTRRCSSPSPERRCPPTSS